MRLLRMITTMAVALLASSIVVADPELPSLRDSYDPALQRGLVATLERLGLRDAVQRRDLAVALVDVTDIDRPRVASVNGDHMMYAASLPKIAILLGAFVQVERGAMRLDSRTRTQLADMIRVSSNEAATAMLRRVGPGNLEAILTSPRYRFYDPLENGGLWVGKEYGPGSAFKRDPLHNLSHGATALQTAKFYYMLEAGRMFRRPGLCAQMKEILGNPGIQHKFVKGLMGRPDTRIFRKSGTWQDYHSDSAIVEHGRYRYIVVALAHDRAGGEWLVNMASPLNDLIVPLNVAGR